MQTPSERTGKLLLSTEAEIFEKLVESDNPFRTLKAHINFRKLTDPLRDLYSDFGVTGIDIEKGFKTLLIQFWEDYSDREMERALRHNIVVRWFCGFGLIEHTPDHTYFTKLRARIGAERLAQLFNDVNLELQEQGFLGDVFTFIDASTMITKSALWKERDKAIKAGEEKLNNAVVSKYAKDTEARWGAKSKHNIWFGYKRHTAIDMRSGLIKKTLVTPANVPDFRTVKELLPVSGMVCMDKLYDTKDVDELLRAHGLYAATIRKITNPFKNPDLDRFHSALRMPFEGTFSKLSKRARYRGLSKVSFQNTFQSLAYNLKKLLALLLQGGVLQGV